MPVASENRLGAKIQHLREQAGLTQAELAQRAGLTQGAVSRYEKGKREPTVSAAAAIAHALGTTIDALLSEDD